MSGIMLNENSIAELLKELVTAIGNSDIEGAEAVIEDLNFDRLLKPIEDQSKQRHFVDPAVGFGGDRVHATGDHLRTCKKALRAGNAAAALSSAEAAATRWGKK